MTPCPEFKLTHHPSPVSLDRPSKREIKSNNTPDRNEGAQRVSAMTKNHSLPLILALTVLFAAGNNAHGEERDCSQTKIDGTTPPDTLYFIYPRVPVKPFYQWENNDGYCGEVSMMEAGFNNGQWMSQYNARLICGTGLSQAGRDGFCEKHHVPDFNAQLLIESPHTGVSGPHRYADAAMCLSNSRLHASRYDYTVEKPGLEGYREYMRWVKAEVIEGHQVTVALLDGGGDPQEDHEVSVVKIGTNHCLQYGPNNTCAEFDNSRYYGDDVLYFEDHGANSAHPDSSPPIPPGAGRSKGCTPYIYGYSFKKLAKTEAEENKLVNEGPLPGGKQAYAIVIPGGSAHAKDFKWIWTGTGGNGYSHRKGYPWGDVRIRGPHNFAFSVWGPEDPTHETLPVALTIIGPTYTKGIENPLDPVPGFGEHRVDAWYENPMIGKSYNGNSCTNRLDGWMTIYNLQAKVSGLTPGVSYNLYEYIIPSLSVNKIGHEAALPVPVRDFNAQSYRASNVTTFTATGPTYTQTIDAIPSSEVVVFRCVPVSGP